MKAIEVQNLKKSFGDFHAVQDASFEAEAGEVLSLLGPNGAGKSTTISILSGLLAPTSGDACIMGHSVIREPEAAKKSLGVVPQDIALYPDLSARENLVFWGKMYGLRGNDCHIRILGDGWHVVPARVSGWHIRCNWKSNAIRLGNERITKYPDPRLELGVRLDAGVDSICLCTRLLWASCVAI